MAINEFDALVDKNFGPGAANPFDSVVTSARDTDKQQVQTSMYAASEGPDPDRQARIMDLSKKTKLPTNIVADNFDSLSKKVQFESNDFDSLVDKSPALSNWLKDPNNATLAKDEIQDLGKIESSVQSFGLMSQLYNKLNTSNVSKALGGIGNPLGLLAAGAEVFSETELGQQSAPALGVGALKVAKSFAQFPAALYDVAAYPQNLGYRLAGSGKRLSAPEWLQVPDVIEYYNDAIENLAPPMMNQSFTEAVGKGNYSDAGQILALQVLANAPNQAILIAAAMSNPAAGLYFAGASSATDSISENRANGVDPVVGVPAAIAKGTIEASFESLGTFKFIDKWSKALSSEIGEQSARQVMTSTLKVLGAGAVTEGTEEGLTSGAQDLVDYASGVNKNALQGFVPRMLDAAAVGAASGTAMTGPATLGHASSLRDQKSMDVNSSRNHAQLSKDFVTNLGSMIDSSKLKGRSPEAAETLVAKFTEGTPVQDAYISADALDTFFQSKNQSGAAIAAKLGVTTEYDEAKTSGVDIRIPLSKLITALDPEDRNGLLDDLKYSQDTQSINEAKATQKAVKDDLDKYAAEGVKGADELAAEAKKIVQQNLQRELRRSGMDQKEANYNASILAGGLDSLAQSAGTNATELRKEFPLNIEASNSAPGASVFEGAPNVATEGYDVNTVNYLKRVINQSEAGARLTKVNEDGEVIGTIAKGSTFPDFFKDKGYTKKEALNVIEKHLAGKPLTEKQQIFFDDMYFGLIDDNKRGKYYQSANEEDQGSRTLFQKVKDFVTGNAPQAAAQESQEPKIAPPFYSKLTQTVEQKMGGRAKPAEILAMLRDMKPEEMKFSGIKEFLEGKDVVTKAELLDHLRANQVEIKEITKAPTEKPGEVVGYTVHYKWTEDGRAGRIAQTYTTEAEAKKAMKDSEKRRGADNTDWGIREVKSRAEVIDDTKYSRYVLPGGENYREVLFHLPPDIKKAMEDLFKKPSERTEQNVFRSSHFDEINILAHTRLNDRTDSDGNKVLFIEEVQSDWHQDGRKKGYESDVVDVKEEISRLDSEMKTLADQYKPMPVGAEGRKEIVEQYKVLQKKKGELESSDYKTSRAVPDAPFRKTWHEYVLKRLIREAAEKGYDKIAWTTGEQQADRYDLAKQVDKVSIRKNADGTYDAEATQDNQIVSEQNGIKESGLEGLFGKDLTAKIIEGSGKPQGSNGYLDYEGNDLKVGGEGMKGFYDKILVDAANKLAKKSGAKVEETTVSGTQDESDYEVHSLTITPELKAEALNQGFTLFQSEPKYGTFAVRPDMPESVSVLTLPQETISEAKHESLKAAKDYATDNLRNHSVRNEMTGMDIDLPQGGFKKVYTGKDSIQNIVALTHIDQLIKTAVYDGFENVEKNKPNVKGYYRFYAPMSVGDKTYLVRIKVSESNEGLRFYHEVGVEKEIPTGNLKQKDSSESIQQAVSGDNKQSSIAQPFNMSISDFAEAINGARKVYPWFQDKASPRGQIKFKARAMTTFVAKTHGNNFGVFDGSKSTTEPTLVAEFKNEADARIYSSQLRDIGNTHTFVSLINLFKGKRDESTFAHEASHHLFEIMGVLAERDGTNQKLKDDYKTLLDYVGVESRSEIEEEHHEKIAKAFETYLMEGKAPSEGLRKAFKNFQTWLVAIYKGVPRQELSDEVRSVFDRLLVSEQQVEHVETEMGHGPLFADAVAAGMSEPEALKYSNALLEAKQAAESRLRAKLMEDVLKKQRADYKEERERIAARVTKELNEERVYIAKSILEDGVMPDGSPLAEGQEAFKLNRDQIKGSYGVEGISPKAMASDGIDAQLAADMLGYFVDDEMVAELKLAIPKAQAIKELVDAEMRETRPDLLTSPQLSEETVKAVHGHERAKVLRMELEHLAKNNLPALKVLIRKLGGRVPTEAQVREQAQKTIGTKVFKDIRPKMFQRAEIKAANEAVQLLTKGDIAGAFAAKQRELFNHELFLAANDAIDRVQKDVKKLKKNFFKSNEDIARTRDVDLVNAGKAILSAYGIGSESKSPSEYLKSLKQYDPDTFETVSALIDSVVENRANYRDISYDKFVDMSDSVQAVWDLAKSTREMTVEGLKVDRADVLDQLNARIDEVAGEDQAPGSAQAVTKIEKLEIGAMGVRARMRKVEHWAYAFDKGVLNGVFSKFIARPVIEAQTRYELARVQVHTKLAELSKGLTRDNTTKLEATEIGYTFQGKQELIAALLHTGNESNFQKLLLGRKWGSENADGSLNTAKWDAMIARMQDNGTLTKADYDFVQAIWSLNETIKPGAQKAHKQMYGHYFNEITAKEFSTPFGNYAGGYMPAIVDPYLVQDGQTRTDKEALEKLGNSFMFPTTGRGFSKSRVENYNAALLLDLNRIPGQLDKVLRFTHMEPTIKEVARIVNSDSFKNNMARVDPTIVNEALIPWLQRSALQSKSVPLSGKGGAFADKVLNGLRSNASLQFMAVNIPNMIQNLTGAFPALIRVKPQHLIGAFGDYLRSPGKLSEFIQSKSDYMKIRIGNNASNISKQFKEVLLQNTKYNTVKEAARDFAYLPEKATNGIIELVAWNGAYRQHLSEGNTETESVKFADSTIRQVQTDASPAGSSSMESGNSFERLFTMFSMYFNNMGNLLGSELSIAKELGFKTKDGGARAAKAYALVVMAPAIVSAIIARSFGGKGLDEDDDGKYLDDILDIIFMSQVKYMAAMVPGGTIVNTFMNQFNDKPYDDKINVSPAASGVETLGRSLVSVPSAIFGKGDGTKALKDGLAAIGLITGLPTPIISKPASYLMDVSKHKAKPTGPIDFTRGLVTGKPGKRP